MREIMRLSSEEKAMLNGELGEGKKWALKHQLILGNFFDADELPESPGWLHVRRVQRPLRQRTCSSNRPICS